METIPNSSMFDFIYYILASTVQLHCSKCGIDNKTTLKLVARALQLQNQV